MELYNALSLRPQVLTILLVTIALSTIFIVYYVKLKKLSYDQTPTGFVLIMQIFIGFCKNLVVDVLGPKAEKVTPYFIFLFSYILLSNIVGIFGFSNPTASLTVTMSLGLVTWIGIFVIGFKYQRWSYLNNFCVKVNIKGKKIPVMINPMEVVSALTPFISISFRLWGNIFAGSMITGLWFYFTAYVSNNIPVIGVINLLAGLTAFPLHAYFDLLCGVIQTLVFCLLTMVYWNLAKGEVQDQKINKKTESNNSIMNLNKKSQVLIGD